LTLWKWIEAGVLTALTHQLVRAVLSVFVLPPFYVMRGQLWRSPGDPTFAWFPLVYLFVGFSLAYVYWRVRTALPGRGWRKGMWFGFGVWILASVPFQFSRFVLMPYPAAMAGVEILGDLVAYLASGMILVRLLEPRIEDSGLGIG
jgi:hypothetical protein